MDETTWYPRLADIPSIGYVTPAGIDRRKLPKHDLEPQIESYEFDGVRRRYLLWKKVEGQTSQSPAAEWGQWSDDSRALTTPDLLRRLHEALELPGRPSDYHFAILPVYGQLWQRRREEPDVLPEMERLCLLDVALLEKMAEIPHKVGGRDIEPPLQSPAFLNLVRLYERNGFLDDALAIAKRGAALGACPGEVERLIERIASLQAEDAR